LLEQSNMAAEIQTALTILRRKQVEARTGLSRSTIYDRMKEGTFPKPIVLGGGRAVGWLEQEISEWVAALVAKSRQA
jgi:prophage regulatory protein